MDNRGRQFTIGPPIVQAAYYFQAEAYLNEVPEGTVVIIISVSLSPFLGSPADNLRINPPSFWTLAPLRVQIIAFKIGVACNLFWQL